MADILIMSYSFNTILILSLNSIVNFTKGINEYIGKLPVDKYMDSVSGIGHRVKHGHDLTFLPEIYNKFGIDGVSGYFSHIIKDLMSPHGVPLSLLLMILENCLVYLICNLLIGLVLILVILFLV